jgi:hypothetical protein
VRFKPFHPSIGQHKNRSKGNVFEYCLLPDYLSIKIEDYMSTVQTSSVFSLLLYVGILLTSLLSVNKLPTPTTPVQSPLRHRIKPVLSRILHTKHGIAALARLRRISTRGIHSIHGPHIALRRICRVQIKPRDRAITHTILPLHRICRCTGVCGLVADDKADLFRGVR